AGNVRPVDIPAASTMGAAASTVGGESAGQYALPAAPTGRHGFVLTVDGQLTTFDPPGSVFTNALGINERGDVVGRYCAAKCGFPGSGSFHAFLLQDGAFTNIDVSGAIETDAFGINGPEQIAGGFLGADHHERIFVLNQGEYTAIAAPGGKSVSLDKGGINERGEIVGTY